ncbi:MAG: tyrosine--tRNA ligase [Patescibacteria group bacterium]
MMLSQELTWRGLVHQTTFKDIAVLDGEPITFYWGVDPSADSMTIGNLAAAMMVKSFIKHGHKAVLLVGGATGMIGDPDGKSSERDLISSEELERNKQAIISQYKQIFEGQDFEVVDNYDWFKSINYLDFLRDTGKHVPMRQMLARDFVQTRLSENGAGISYAEFSYVLIQAYDFLHLYKEHGVTLQVCGSDQWGNSIAGVDLIRRKTGGEANVYSVPLVVNKSTGQKFGKSEDGAIWLDANKTSPYQFYQFWLNVDDESVGDYLKLFTEQGEGRLDAIMQEFGHNRGSRLAQKTLAYEVTKLVHGQEAADSQKRIVDVLFGGDEALELGTEEFAILEKELPTANVSKGLSPEDLTDALVKTGLASSKTEARRFVEGGAIYVDNQKVASDFHFDAQSKSAVMVRRGKNVNAVLKLDG